MNKQARDTRKWNIYASSKKFYFLCHIYKQLRDVLLKKGGTIFFINDYLSIVHVSILTKIEFLLNVNNGPIYY